jgi:hypothetical protein
LAEAVMPRPEGWRLVLDHIEALHPEMHEGMTEETRRKLYAAAAPK